MDEVVEEEDLSVLSELEGAKVRDWLIEVKAAYPSGERRDDLRLTGLAADGVIVEDAVAVIDRRVAGPVGALVDSPSAGASAAIWMGFDLTDADGADRRAFEVHHEGGSQWLSTSYFVGNAITLAKKEHLPLGVVSCTGRDTVWWRIKFTVVVAGITRHVTYPRPGQEALVTSNSDDAEQYWFTGVAGAQGPPWLRQVSRAEFIG